MSSSSSPARPTATSATGPAYAPNSEMGADELMVAFNLPELLVADLESSESIFTSKAMTAGLPCAGLAAPYMGTTLSFQRPHLPSGLRHEPHQEQQLGLAIGKPRSRSLLAGEPNTSAGEPDHDTERGIQNQSPESISIKSSGMEAPSIRTRHQSYTTAATSLSRPCSSIYSHSTLSPASPLLSPCSSFSHERSSHGTWYEDEPEESQQDDVGSSLFTARTSISDPHQPVSAPGDEDRMAVLQRQTTNQDGIPTTPAYCLAGGCCSTHSPPRTPVSQLQLEKPRIIDILPAATGLSRNASTKRGRSGAESASIASESQESGAGAPIAPGERQRRVSYEGDAQEQDTDLVMSLLATANGRTVIDASAPPPIPFARRGGPIRHPHPGPPLLTVMDESNLLDDEEGPSAKEYAEAPTGAQKPSLADLRYWVDASAETMASPQHHTACAPNLHPPGIPLPPEVMESLRISVSCFPETVLLTSSFSIETIRGYSKKVRHRANFHRHLRNADSDSIYSSKTDATRSSRRWYWPAHARRTSRQHPQTHPPHPHSPVSLNNTSTPLPTPNPYPIWAPIQNIFPRAPSHLCDALYAHLLAYNYITSLFPTTTTTTTKPTTTPTTRRSDTTSATNGGIPNKAASLLGMNMDIHLHQRPPVPPSPPSRSPSLRMRGVLVSRNRQNIPHQHQHHLAQHTTRSESTTPATPQSGNSTSSSAGHHGHGMAEGAMRDVRRGLGRCVGLLVAVMMDGRGAVEEGVAAGGGGGAIINQQSRH